MESSRFDVLLNELRRDVFQRLEQVEQEIRSLNTVANATQLQVLTHKEVCEEKQRQLEKFNVERMRWEEDRIGEWRHFMAESRSDRAALREAQNVWGMRLVWVIAIVNTIAAAGGAAVMKTHFLGLG